MGTNSVNGPLKFGIGKKKEGQIRSRFSLTQNAPYCFDFGEIQGHKPLYQICFQVCNSLIKTHWASFKNTF